MNTVVSAPVTTTLGRGRRAKGFFKTRDIHTASEWAVIIVERIRDTHMQGWVASIIAWDLENDKDFAVLDDLMSGYSVDKARKLSADTIIDALTSIGYEHAEERCRLYEDTFAATRWRIGAKMDRETEHYGSLEAVS